jgi:hypothetical protein
MRKRPAGDKMRIVLATCAAASMLATSELNAAELRVLKIADYAGQPITTYTRRSVAPGIVVPDCDEVRGRLLSCIPRAEVSEDAPGVIEALEGPPSVRQRPYPQIFSWPR